MDDATSEIYGRGGRHVHLPGARCSPTRGCPGLYTDRQPLLPHPRGRRQGRQGSTHPGRPRPPSARHRAHRCLFARGPRPSERAFGTFQDRLVGTLAGGSKPLSQTPLPDHNRRFTTPPDSKQRLRAPRTPRRSTTSVARAVARDNTVRSLLPETPLRQGHGPGPRVSRRNPRPLPRAPMPRPLQPTASPSKPQPGRPRGTLRRDRPAPCGQVDSRAAPDHFPTGQTATTESYDVG